MSFLLLLCAGWIGSSTLLAEEFQCATLIVNYQTGPKEERLERVRFFLENEQLEQQLYPKGSLAQTNDNCFHRTVVIDPLPPGKYTLHFLIPNSDDLFEEVAPCHIELHPGETLRVSQNLKPRYASLKAIALPAENASKFSSPPMITLKNRVEQVRAQSTLGKLNVHYLLPGPYTLIFEPILGYKTPAPFSVLLEPNEQSGPFIGVYSF